MQGLEDQFVRETAALEGWMRETLKEFFHL